ncbi:MAG TPA: RDD family protein [Anaeromyxobacteraceae bacterium]
MLGPQFTFETPERALLALDVAGLGGRALAYLVDLLVIFLFWVTALLVYSIAGDLLRRVQEASFGAQAVAVVLFFFTGWAYDVAWETAWSGQTPGKRLLGLRVVGRDGAPVSFVESLVRNVLRAVEVPLLYAPGVLMVALTSRHQRLGDLVAGTLVVKDRAYDLSRYAAAARLDPRWAALRSRAGPALPPADFERLSDFLRRRGGLDPVARERIAMAVAGALASRADLAAPPPAEAEAFLEAFAAASAGEGGT